ncbi:hypothetical protein AB0C51_00360 [Streptomyces pathocidini]|uniref:hypothetical protein n=1 Tax=Streptomyces pathocidini TaxID=1650571 RepID=UPI0033FA4782
MPEKTLPESSLHGSADLSVAPVSHGVDDWIPSADELAQAIVEIMNQRCRTD